ncbi:hypothetical protein BpHYR1_038329 [Brachionus plicatilis]|uniref:Uncharacterized protein n=1 Tax=Brachionus plicatilis TaxID=10195 RepID=A0A3M7SGM2_BRAPC|nr:hypothetical protein BpHYR1_038329 [Brachionus plicatilis]
MDRKVMLEQKNKKLNKKILRKFEIKNDEKFDKKQIIKEQFIKLSPILRANCRYLIYVQNSFFLNNSIFKKIIRFILSALGKNISYTKQIRNKPKSNLL